MVLLTTCAPDVIITNYRGASGRTGKFSTGQVLPKKIVKRHKYTRAYITRYRVDTVLGSIMEECIKHEPYVSSGRSQILDAAGPFANEVAFEVCCLRYLLERCHTYGPLPELIVN